MFKTLGFLTKFKLCAVTVGQKSTRIDRLGLVAYCNQRQDIGLMIKACMNNEHPLHLTLSLTTPKRSLDTNKRTITDRQRRDVNAEVQAKYTYPIDEQDGCTQISLIYNLNT